jgi:CRISPR-associated endonuclease/helicase Cas3
MATANAAFERKQQAIGALLEDAAVILRVHSQRRLMQSEALTRAGEEDGSAAPARAWLERSGHRLLLARAAVGTVDQALIGVLPTRHQAIRLWGLAGKAVVIDEVHAYDDYMQALLEALLRHHALVGGHVVLMSATLPSRLRHALMTAFAEAAGWPVPPAEALRRCAYPLLTHLSAGRLSQQRVAPAGGATARPVRFEAVHAEAEAEAQILAWARAGRSVGWFRNTVRTAIEAWDRLGKRLEFEGLPPPILFHSRFLPDDRAAIERTVLDRLGKDGDPACRRGQVLIATQVAEQSLDIDLDEAVIDLAPADAVLQRAGRRRRHVRDAEGQRLPGGADQRPDSAVLLLLPPLPDAGADWPDALLPGTAVIYPDRARLWLGALHLLDPATIPGRCGGGSELVPDRDGRALLESVYADDDAVRAQVPECVGADLDKVAGERLAERQTGLLATLPFAAGWPKDWYNVRQVTDDEAQRAVTRLGEAYPLVLARRDDDGVRLLAEGPWAVDRSTVRLAQRLRPEPDSAVAPDAIVGLTAAQRELLQTQRVLVMRDVGERGLTATARLVSASGRETVCTPSYTARAGFRM